MKKTVSFSKHSRNIFFHILTKCNLKCQHCYINPIQHGENTLSLQTIDTWLTALWKKEQQTNIIFLGGEPTLHPDLPLIIKRANDIGFQSITIDTNGYLFHDFLKRVTPDEVDYLSFSLDGATAQTNDSIRGEGSYRICIDNIKNAVSKGFHTSLIYTVSQKNIHELEMMEKLLKDLGVERFFIQVIGLRGRSSTSISTPPPPSLNLQVPSHVWLDVIPQIAENIAHNNIIVTYPKVFLPHDERFECAGLVADNFFIFPNGRIYRCPLCEDFPIHSMVFKNNQLHNTAKLNETDFFSLTIPEGCVMNKLIQPENITYTNPAIPDYKIACCLLKEEICHP